MRSLAAAGAALLVGGLAGGLLETLLAASHAALPPSARLGLGLAWVAGVGLGFLLRAWSAELPRFVGFGLGAAFVLLGAVVLLPALPLGWGSSGGGAQDLLERLVGIFWDSGSTPARVAAWRMVFVAAGLLAGLPMGTQLGLRALGFAAGVGLVDSLPLESLESLVVMGLGALLFAAGGLWAGWSRRRASGAARMEPEADMEAYDFGWSDEEPPVLRPRLGGVMLLVMLVVALVVGMVAGDLDVLVGVGTSEQRLGAAALAFGLGCFLGSGLFRLAPRLRRAELVPLFLLFGAATWASTSLGFAGSWLRLGERLLARLPSELLSMRPAIEQLWAGLAAVGPVALSAGAAATLLPRLAFTRTPEGARRAQVLLGLTVLSLGGLASARASSLLFVSPGPALWIAGLVALAATTLYLVVDLRGQSVAAVKGPVGHVVPALARGVVGLLLASLALGLATRSASQAGYPEAQLASALERAGQSTRGLAFGLGDPATGARGPWLESRDWVWGDERRREAEAELLGTQQRLRLIAASGRLARLFGAHEQPLVVTARQQLGGLPAGPRSWVLELGARGPDPRRALSAANYRALGARTGAPQFVCAWLPLELLEDDFQRGLANFAASFPCATSWLVDGAVLLVGSEAPLALDLAGGASARRSVAAFVGTLEAQHGSEAVGGDWQLLEGPGTAQGARVPKWAKLHRRARNLQTLVAGRTLLPPDWGALLGDFPEVAIGRALAELRLAAAWVAYDRIAAPGSLALESWQQRLDGARLDAGLLAPEDPELLALDAQLRAEASLVAARERLAESDPRAAVALLLSARETLAGRGDLELMLAAAFELAGNAGAARFTWSELGERGPALLSGPGAWLIGLGFEPPEERLRSSR